MSNRLATRYASGIAPALELLPAQMRSARAVLMLCAITLQEDPKGMRYQVLDWGDLTRKGAAKGLLQFERGGGVAAVMREGAPSEDLARMVCDERGVAFERDAVWRQLEHDDVLAFAFGRLLLWNLPDPLPSPTDVHKAWGQYMKAWGPGKPKPEEWPHNHAEAVRFVQDLDL